MIRSAKETFVGSAHRTEMERIANSEAFLIACDYAKLMLAEQIKDPLEPTAAAIIVGARRVLDILGTIHEKEPEKEPKRPRLNYNV